MAHPLLEQAMVHTQQARAINDEYEGKTMPAEAARQMEEHLNKASELRRRVDAEARLQETEQWISEPQYKHDMGGPGEKIASEFGHGDYKVQLERDRKERHKKAFFEYIRKGPRDMSPELKGALVEDNTGQNLVPTDFAGTIIQQLPREGVMRNLAYVRPTNSNVVDVGSITATAVGWGKLETGTAPTDAGPGAAKQTITVWDLNALLKLGRDELADADANLEALFRDLLARKFAEVEDDAYASGTGAARPWGLAAGSRITQAVTAAAGETVVPDDLKKLIFAVPAQYRNVRSAFVGHTSAEQAISLLKDTTGNYLLQPSASAGEPGRVFGYRWYTIDGLPAMQATDDAGAGTNPSVVFGDFYSGYMICDRQQLTVQRLTELYAESGQVGLLFTMRVGGDVIRPQALAKYLL
jgi:HK97 family phage major capsid protein